VNTLILDLAETFRQDWLREADEARRAREARRQPAAETPTTTSWEPRRGTDPGVQVSRP
jgi:hypothetical protein